MYRLGKNSKKHLSTANSDIQLIIEEAIKVSDVDFGVSQCARTVEQQQQYFDEGKSKVNPKTYATMTELLDKGKHIVDGNIRKKADAVDVYAYVNGKANWEKHNMCYLGGVITSVANRLYNEGRIYHKLRWGSNWDNDGEIITDQTFQDSPHFESRN